MLRVAPDSSTVEHTLEELYPGGFQIAEWEKCLNCDKEVDAYIYIADTRQGYCFAHYTEVHSHSQ